MERRAEIRNSRGQEECKRGRCGVLGERVRVRVLGSFREELVPELRPRLLQVRVHLKRGILSFDLRVISK